jgi:hypothetical protein
MLVAEIGCRRPPALSEYGFRSQATTYFGGKRINRTSEGYLLLKEGQSPSPDTLGIEYTFSPSLMLRLLLDTDRRRRIYQKLIVKERATNDEEIFVRGFSFAVVSLLDWSLYHLMESPKYLDLREDHRTMATYRKSPSIKSFIDNLQWNSSMNSLARNIQHLRKSVLQAGTWSRLDECSPQVIHFAEVMLKIFDSSCEAFAEIEQGNRTYLDKDDVLRMRATNSLLVFLNDRRFLRSSFSFTLRTEESQLDPEFLPGYSFANALIWEALLPDDFDQHISVFQGLLTAKTWEEFDRNFERINREVVAPFEKRLSFDSLRLGKSGHVPASLRRQLISPIRLAARLSDPAVIFTHPVEVVSAYLSVEGASMFKTVLAGLTYLSFDLHGERASVIELREPGREFHNVFSFALLMPALGMWDYSKWWLFHDFCTDDSGTGSAALADVLRTVESVKQKVTSEVFNVDQDRLSAFLEHDDIAHLRDALKEMADLTQNMKGGMLELMVGEYLSSTGFSQVRLHVQPPLLAGELDVVAKKTEGASTHLTIVECKGASARLPDENEYIQNTGSRESSFGLLEGFAETVDESKEHLDWFRTKLERIREKPSRYLGEFGIKPGEEVKIDGIYVSTSSLPSDSKWICSEFTLWDLETIRTKLKLAHMPENLLAMVERCDSLNYEQFGDRFFDDYFALSWLKKKGLFTKST